MNTAADPQPDPDAGGPLVENEGVNAGSAVDEPGADRRRDDPSAPRDASPVAGPGGGAVDEERAAPPHEPDATQEPGVAVSEADLYGQESGQDVGSMD